MLRTPFSLPETSRKSSCVSKFTLGPGASVHDFLMTAYLRRLFASCQSFFPIAYTETVFGYRLRS